MRQPTSYIKQTRGLYDSLGYPPYAWYHAEEAPAFTRPAKPVADSRVGLVSTAGTYLHGQVAYYYKDDTSIRTIPSSSEVADVRFSHVTENYLVEAREDPRTVFPLEALRALRDDGIVGELATNYFSSMGGIYSQRRVRDELIPALDAAIVDEQLDLLLLIPL